MTKQHTFKYSNAVSEAQITWVYFGTVCFFAVVLTMVASIAYVFGR